MPQQRQEKELLTLNQEKRKVGIPEEDVSLSLTAWHSRVAAHRLGNWKSWHYPSKWVFCLWVTQMATAGQPQHFHPCWPGGWVRPSPAPIIPLHLMCLSDQASAAMVHGRVIKNMLQFLLGCLCLNHSTEHLFPLWSLLLRGDPSHHLFFLSVQAEITGGFCSTGEVHLPAGWEEGEVAQKLS